MTKRKRTTIVKKRILAAALAATLSVTMLSGCGKTESASNTNPSETAEEAVVREVFEETGRKMEIDRLGFIHENFFPGDSLKKQGNIVHEISFFFYMNVPTDFEPVCDSFTEDGDKERLVWIRADHQKKYYPEFFKTELANPSKDVKHYVTKNL